MIIVICLLLVIYLNTINYNQNFYQNYQNYVLDRPLFCCSPLISKYFFISLNMYRKYVINNREDIMNIEVYQFSE